MAVKSDCVNLVLICTFIFNMHRYAFTPLIDDSDDEEIEEFTASANIGTVKTLEHIHIYWLLLIFFFILSHVFLFIHS